MGQKYKSIDDLYAVFNSKQLDYINSTPINDRVPQESLNIHFNQLQEPVISITSSENFDDKELNINIGTLEEDYLQESENAKGHKGYPKKYDDPTDAEYEEKDGKTYYYFNIIKTLRVHNLTFIKKIIPERKLVDWTYDKPLFDKYAQKQHQRVEKLNAMDGHHQFMHDLKVRLIKVGVICAAGLLIFVQIKFRTIPSSKFDKASALMNNEEYDSAYYIYNALGSYNSSYVYAKYCEGQMCLKVGKYDQAKDCFNKLVEYQDMFSDKISMEDLICESDYQKAIDLYNQRNFNQAKPIFKSIYKYSNSTEYYYKCAYQMAMEAYDNGDIYSAIDNIYEAGNANYSDAHDQLIKMADEIYNKAMNAYGTNDYNAALNDFSFLGSYKYKDSQDMFTQCSYQQALECYKKGEYNDAILNFEAIIDYKDSASLIKECTYKLGNQSYSFNPVNSIAQFESIKGYKNTNNLLRSSRLSLYGEWKIVESNGSKVEPILFRFNGNNEFYTDSPISGVAISTEAMPYEYKWVNGQFIALDGEYTMTVIPQESDSNKDYINNVIQIQCNKGQNTYTYLCERTMSYTQMLNYTDETSEENAGLTLNELISKQIEEYIDKKLDGYANIGENSVALVTEAQKLQGTIENAPETVDTKKEEEESNND